MCRLSANGLHARRGHRHRVRAMRRGRCGTLTGNGEVVEAAFGGVAGRERRVVGHIGAGPGHT